MPKYAREQRQCTNDVRKSKGYKRPEILVVLCLQLP
jgi:hypothetical protein